MGMSSDIMHDFAAKEIRSIYSSYDGWKIATSKPENGYDRISVIERRSNGHREVVKMLTSFSRYIPLEMLVSLKKPVPTSDGTLSRNSYAVMVPANTDVSSVPVGIQVYTMRSFASEGNELAWTKKPVRKEETTKVAT
jgi:hypothetical protein